MRRLLYIVPLAIFAIVASYFLAGLGRDPQRLPSALLDKPAPEFALPPLPGRASSGETGLRTADLAVGRPMLVNVFASWCTPCRVEHPVLARLAEEGVAIQGIAYKDKPGAALAFLRELGDPYTRVGLDLDGRAGIEWGVYGVPETFVIDGKGVIRYRYPGPLTPDEIDNVIRPLLRKLAG